MQFIGRDAISGAALAMAAMVAGIAGGSGPAFAYPTTYQLEDAVFDDGGTASGEFTIDVYGYLSGFDLTTTGGSTLSGHVYSTGAPSNICTADTNKVSTCNPTTPPPVYGVDFYSASYNLDLHIVFTAPLGSMADAIDLANSYECAAYTCPGTDPGNTRYFGSGYVEPVGDSSPVPEPAGFGLLATAAAILLLLRWRVAIGPVSAK